MQRPAVEHTLLAILVAAGCAALEGCAISGAAGARSPLWKSPASATTLPDRYHLDREQLVLHSDFPLPEHHRLIDDLQTLHGDLTRDLGLPATTEPVHVYLFESRERFQQFVHEHHPGFPNRRAFFVETDTRLVVYVQWGDRIAEDLRHEVTHGYLHAAAPGLPLWLDEGLAEYYEVPRTAGGVNLSHVERLSQRLRRGGFQPDLKRLERLPDDVDLSQDDYAEAWAWVYYLLDDPTQAGTTLRAYLAELRRTSRPANISDRLAGETPDAAAAMLNHLGYATEQLRVAQQGPR